MKKSWIYILECSDGTYYTGCTSDLEKRISQHKEGLYDGYTSKRLPVKLIWNTEFRNISNAIDAERQVKGWSRSKKEALMKGDFDLLQELAQSKEMKKRRKKRRD
ncbi:MAG: GIY-YIG nuclease family protein [Balneolaceae bacterium]|nr:GIY-YIG nuclease family protein [Balneolaceae bacterium]